MKLPPLIAILSLMTAQTLAWFQSNSGILSGWFEKNALYIAIVCGPLVALLFSISVKTLYKAGLDLYSIRFITFGMGYLVFMPLTWMFLGEHLFTVKNTISFVLCVLLLLTQFYFK